MNHKKIFWIASGILLAIVLVALLVWLGGGIIDMMRAHMGM